MSEASGAGTPGPAVRIRYALLGVAAGGLWLWGAGSPLWEHAVRTLAILLVVPALVGRIAGAVARRRGHTQTVSVGRLVAAKVALVFIAIVVTEAAGHRVAHLDLYLAAWLALIPAVGGPLIHHRLLIEVPGDPREPHRAGRAARSIRGR
jgi:hypothetical protein